MNADSGPKPPLMKRDTDGQSFLGIGSSGMERLHQAMHPRELGPKGDGSKGPREPLTLVTIHPGGLLLLECSILAEALKPALTPSMARNLHPNLKGVGLVAIKDISPGIAGTRTHPGSTTIHLNVTQSGSAPMLGVDQLASIRVIVLLQSPTNTAGSTRPGSPSTLGNSQSRTLRRASCPVKRL